MIEIYKIMHAVEKVDREKKVSLSAVTLELEETKLNCLAEDSEQGKDGISLLSA